MSAAGWAPPPLPTSPLPTCRLPLPLFDRSADARRSSCRAGTADDDPWGGLGLRPSDISRTR